MIISMMMMLIKILMMPILIPKMIPASVSTITINQTLTVLIPMTIHMYFNPQIMLTLNMKTQMIMVILTTQMNCMVMIHLINHKINWMLHNNKTMKSNVLHIPTMNKQLLIETLHNPSKIQEWRQSMIQCHNSTKL